jgi:acetyl esterase/lipase
MCSTNSYACTRNYRLAPEFPHPTPVEDCYAALMWLHLHSANLGIDKSRIAVAGLSAGGGLAAAVALMARDRDLQPPLAKQLLFCPMLDDRNLEADTALEPFVTWSWDDNWTGWNALLEGKAGSSDVPAYAAPARAENLAGLPPTYVDVGTLDIFAEESERYVSRLREAGVPVEWHLYPGVPHVFEFAGRRSKIHREAQSYRDAAMRQIGKSPSAL